MITIFTLLATWHSLWATTPETSALRTIMQTRSAKTVSDSVEKFESLRAVRMACQFQLKEKQIPIACYQSLHMEHDIPAKVTKLSAQLDSICTKNAVFQSASAQPQLPQNFPKNLSLKCHQEWERARAIIQYRKDADWSNN